MKDKEIIEHLRNNHFPKAVKGIYSCFPSIRTYILRQGGKKEDAEDMFQEALIILHKKVQTTDFELCSSLKTYLTGISKNLWNAELRRRGKSSIIESFEYDYEQENYEKEMKYKKAEWAFNQLGEKCKQLLTLYYFKNLSMQKAAEIMGFLNEKVAKNQKYRCLEKAKSHFLDLIP